MVILFWLLIAGIFVALFMSFAGLGVYGHRKNKPILKWLGIIPASGIILLGISFVGLIAYSSISLMFPSNVYEFIFETPPPEFVTELKSDFFWFADTGSTYLKFKIPESKLISIMPSDLIEKSAEQMEREVEVETGPNIPDWWNFKIDDNWKYFHRKRSHDDKVPSKRSFENENEYAGYDTRSNTVYYRYLGIDY